MVAAVLTSKGRDITTASIFQSALPSVPKIVAWGTNPNSVTSASAPDVSLFAEASEARTTGTASVVTTTTTDDTFQVTGTITCAGAGKTIAEVALYDNATRSTVNTTWATAPTTTSGTTGTLTANAGFASGNVAQ